MKIELSGAQLKDALDLIAPDGDDEQLAQSVVIEWKEKGQLNAELDDEVSPAGFYACYAEYPEEGWILLGPDEINEAE